MAFTGDAVSANRALQFGLYNELYNTKEDLLKGARAMATRIAANSPLVVQGTKISLDYSDEHSTIDCTFST
jgi:enoyl-CoA hydratase